MTDVTSVATVDTDITGNTPCDFRLQCQAGVYSLPATATFTKAADELCKNIERNQDKVHSAAGVVDQTSNILDQCPVRPEELRRAEPGRTSFGQYREARVQ